MIVHPAVPTDANNFSSRTVSIQINTERKTEDVKAAIRLPSGDVKITFKDEGSRKKAENIPAWITKVFGPGAEIKKASYVVLVHGLDTKDIRETTEEALLEELKADNHPIKITGAKQPLKQTRKEGGRTTLLVTVDDAASANTLCKKGLIWRYQNFAGNPYSQDSQVTRCYKCNRFGHKAKFCREEQTCGWCSAADHPEAECVKKRNHTDARCVNCKGEHPAWAYNCPIAKKESAAARDAFFNRPARFAELVPDGPRPDEDGWTVVSSPTKRKARSPIAPPAAQRGPGRPPKTAMPATFDPRQRSIVAAFSSQTGLGPSPIPMPIPILPPTPAAQQDQNPGPGPGPRPTDPATVPLPAEGRGRGQTDEDQQMAQW
jgi:hypothetical protein